MGNYIALDVGGTSISAAIVSTDGRFIIPPQHYKALSGEDKHTILNNFARITNSLILETHSMRLELNGIGVAFPGPFDYERGISLMKGLQKYDSIYQVNIAAEMKPILKADLEMRFLNDADLYCLGECIYGVGKAFKRSMFICIGTGINSGFFSDGRLIKAGDDIPQDGWISYIPYRDGIITDYLSAIGIRRMMRECPATRGIKDVKELAQAAMSGMVEAKGIFDEFGRMLYEVVAPFAIRFNTEALILGGDVCRSHYLFDKPLVEGLAKENIKVLPSVRFSENTLLACAFLFESPEVITANRIDS
jgi:glucokinase